MSRHGPGTSQSLEHPKQSLGDLSDVQDLGAGYSLYCWGTVRLSQTVEQRHKRHQIFVGVLLIDGILETADHQVSWLPT